MTVRDRYEGLQSILQRCGSDDCFFLSIASIIEDVNKKPIDLIEMIRYCMSKGWITQKFYITDSLAILCHYTGKSWIRRSSATLPKIGDNDYTVAVWYNDRTQFTHYRRRGYDSLEDSVTVKEGYIRSYYIYTWSY